MSGEVRPEGTEAAEPVVRPVKKGGWWLWSGGGLLAAGLVVLYLGWREVRWRTDPQRTAAHRTAVYLQTAVEAYQAEYEHLPVVASGSGRIDTTTADGMELMRILTGLEQKEEGLKNPDQVKFLSLPEGLKAFEGGPRQGEMRPEVEGLYDPWGGPYQILLDTSGDGSIAGPDGSGRIKGSVAVYTAGPDRRTGTGDDVKSWGR